jgi:hypothetical protein
MTMSAYYAAGPAFFPRRAMARFGCEPRPLRMAAGAVGFVGALYVVTSLVLALAGSVPLVTAVLPIPPENYFFWQTFFAFPFVVLGWAAAAGLLHLLGRRGRGRKALLKTAAPAGVAAAAAMFMAWLPMALAAFLLVSGMGQEELVDLLSPPGPWQVFDIGLYVLAAAAAAVLLTLAAGYGKLKGSGRTRAALHGALAAAVLSGLYAIFIR